MAPGREGRVHRGRALGCLTLLGLCLLAASLARGPPGAEGDGASQAILALVRASPLTLELRLESRRSKTRDRLLVQAIAQNRGQSDLRDLDAALHSVGLPCIRVLPEGPRHRGVLKQDESVT